MRPARLAVVALAAVLATVLASCGEPDPPEEAPAEVLNRSFRVTGVTTLLTGSEPHAPLELEFTAELKGLGVDGSIVFVGDELYVVLFGENYRAEPETVADLRARLLGLGLAAGVLFPQPNYDGVEELEGEDVVRIVSPAGGLRELEAVTGVDPGPGEAEAWVSLDDDSLRRLRLSFPDGAELDVSVSSGTGIEPPEGGGFRPLSELLSRSLGLID